MQKRVTLKDNRDFKRLYRGKFAAGQLVVCYAAKGRGKYTRIGITTGKKLGSAVQRNRCRRLIRAAWQQLMPECAGKWDIVFVARAPIVDKKCQAVTKDMRKQFTRLGLIKKPAPPPSPAPVEPPPPPAAEQTEA